MQVRKPEPYYIVGYRIKRWSDLSWSKTIDLERECTTDRKSIRETQLLDKLKAEDEDILDVKLITEAFFNS